MSWHLRRVCLTSICSKDTRLIALLDMFKVKMWGVRGSIPAPYTPTTTFEKIESVLQEYVSSKEKDPKKFLASLPTHLTRGFGGNTTCVEVFTQKSQVIIDGGSGIRLLGMDLMKGPCGKGQGEVHICFTHFHWDHLIGLPFFVPFFIPGNKIHLYAVQKDLQEAIKLLFKKPFFPVEFENLGAKIIFHELKRREPTKVGDLTFTPYLLDHPDPCWGYKFEHEGRSYAHCVDNEATRVTAHELAEDLPLYQNIDLMLFDAQYTISEIIDKTDWGHAAAPLALEIAMREGVKKLLLTHHDPYASDEKIRQAVEQTQQYYEICLKKHAALQKKVNRVDWQFAVEGSVFDV